MYKNRWDQALVVTKLADCHWWAVEERLCTKTGVNTICASPNRHGTTRKHQTARESWLNVNPGDAFELSTPFVCRGPRESLTALKLLPIQRLHA